MKREAQFTLLFRHWLKAHPMDSAAFELKQTRTQSISFSSVQEHQIDALFAVKHDGLLWKLPDDSRGIKPMDMMYLRNAEAYVVIRYPDFFVLIDIDDFRIEKRVSPRKSLTAFRAKEIASQVIPL